MALPSNRVEFKEYCLRALGAPVTNIEVDDEQVEDRIDEALSLFQRFHYDGTERIYLKHLITEEDKQKKYLTLSPLIVSVVDILDLGIGGSVSSLFNVRYQLAMNDLWDLSSASLIPYVMARTHISLFQYYFDQQPHIRFNSRANILYLDADWDQLVTGQFMIAECFRILDPAVSPGLWADDWLRSYAIALIKRQWGANIKIFNVPLLGGATVNGKEIFDEACSDIKDLEQKLQDAYVAPAHPFIG